MKNKIIFLDIDGVLNSMAYFTKLKNEKGEWTDEHYEIGDIYLKRLAQIYKKTNASIVLSSTWRQLNDDTLADAGKNEALKMYKYLEDSLIRYKMKIEDKTPYVHMNRPLEILTWLKEHNMDNEKTRFVSLDDDFSFESYERYGIEKCLIRTIFFTDNIDNGGLQDEHIKKAIEILNGKSPLFSKKIAIS